MSIPEKHLKWSARRSLPEFSPAYVDHLEAENALLRDQLRWRKYPEERPEVVSVLVLTSGGCLMVDGSVYLTPGDRWLPIPPQGQEGGK